MAASHPDVVSLLDAIAPKAAREKDPRTPFQRATEACMNGRARHAIEICKRHPQILGSRSECENPSPTSERHSLLGFAQRDRRGGLFCDLLALGAWPAKIEASEDDVARLVEFGCPDHANARLWLACLQWGEIDPLRDAADAIVKSGRAAPDWKVWARHALGRGQLQLAVDIFDEQGFEPGAADLDVLCKTPYLNHFWNLLHCDAPERKNLSHQLAALEREILQRGPADMPQDVVDLVWTEAAMHGALADLRWMASRGWLPQGWAAVDDEKRSTNRIQSNARVAMPAGLPRRSLVEAAWARQQRELARALIQIPQAAQALLDMPPPPERLKNFASGELAQLREWGVDIFAKNSQGQNFLHFWAKEDGRKPRAGWAAIARINPDALESRDESGQTPIGAQMAALAEGSSARAEFGRLAASIAKSQLRHAASPAPKTPKASRPRL